jgi:flagellin
MSVINTNVNAVLAQNSLVKNERAMSSAMEQLSTGKRINSAADDAAGMAIASKMTAQIRGLDQAGRNINDAVAMIQTAEGATGEITNMLQRMRELAVQASSGTYTTEDKANIELEFQALLKGIDNIAGTTQWNGGNILDGTGSATTFQIGANDSQTLTVNLGNLKTNGYAVAVTTAISAVAAVAAVAGSAGVNTVTTSSAQAVLLTSFVAGNVTVSMTAGTVTTVSSLATYLNTQTAFAASYTALATSATVMTITEKSGAYTATGPTVSTVTTATSAASYSIAPGVATVTAVTAVTAVATSSAVLGLGADISALKSTTSGVLATLDTALEAVATQNATNGAAINQLEYTADSLANVSLNTQASRSRIEDADYAKATTELARTQIIQQAGTAMLAQANQQSQGVLALLQ